MQVRWQGSRLPSWLAGLLVRHTEKKEKKNSLTTTLNAMACQHHTLTQNIPTLVCEHLYINIFIPVYSSVLIYMQQLPLCLPNTPGDIQRRFQPHPSPYRVELKQPHDNGLRASYVIICSIPFVVHGCLDTSCQVCGCVRVCACVCAFQRRFLLVVEACMHGKIS